jgi:Rho termination factor, N-terminal domain
MTAITMLRSTSESCPAHPCGGQSRTLHGSAAAFTGYHRKQDGYTEATPDGAKERQEAQAGARKKKTITKLPKKTRTALGREGAKAAARKRGASKGTGTGAGAMTVTELRRKAAKLGIEGRSKMGKAQLIRAVGQKRRKR